MNTFADIRPGDKFTLIERAVTGVCVHAPTVVRVEKKGFLWWKKETTIMHATCIELHSFLGAVPWNPEVPSFAPVEILERH